MALAPARGLGGLLVGWDDPSAFGNPVVDAVEVEGRGPLGPVNVDLDCSARDGTLAGQALWDGEGASETGVARREGRKKGRTFIRNLHTLNPLLPSSM